LTLAGAPDEEFHHFVTEALESGQADATERIPYRIMELSWLRSLLQHDSVYQSKCTDILQYTILATRAHPLYMFPQDSYAITHELMYLTNFGASAPPPSLDIGRIADMLNTNLAWHALSENLDILGELLIGATTLRLPWSPYVKLAWWLLSSAWDEVGVLPGPKFDRSAYDRLTGSARDDHVFVHSYHTMFVGGILCALLSRFPEEGNEPIMATSPIATSQIINRCLAASSLAARFCRAGKPPSEETNRATSTPKPDESLGAATTFDEGMLPWRRHRQHERGCPLDLIAKPLAQCESFVGPTRFRCRDVVPGSPLDCTSLAVVIGDAVLIHAGRRYDLALLTKTLTEWAMSRLPISHTFLEATSFLLRQQLPSGAIGAFFVVQDNLKGREARDVTMCLAYCLASVAKRLISESEQNERIEG